MNTAEARFQGPPGDHLAEEFGTPLFVYDTEVLEGTYRRLRTVLPETVDVFYSLKANPNISVSRSSARRAPGRRSPRTPNSSPRCGPGWPPGTSSSSAPARDARELAACVDAGIHAVVCESLEELSQLDDMVARSGRARRSPCCCGSTRRSAARGRGRHGRQTAAVRHRRGGGAPRQGHAGRAAARAGPGRARLHGHPVLKHEDVVRNTAGILSMAEDLAGHLGIPLETVDFGGGPGSPTSRTRTTSTRRARRGRPRGGRPLRRTPSALPADHGTRPLPHRRGRNLCGPRALCKQSRGEWFVVADGGTNHQWRRWASAASSSGTSRTHLGRPADPAARPYTLTGPLCTPNDVVAKRVPLPEVVPGDLLGVERSGAYGPTASPGLFLSHGFPAEVLVHPRPGPADQERTRPRTCWPGSASSTWAAPATSAAPVTLAAPATSAIPVARAPRDARGGRHPPHRRGRPGPARNCAGSSPGPGSCA
ncbi:diaminopimelate decarboxylase [Streptomyces tricolor]|nr:diaminopimelate decarboxylase [Streptomyces tricolor]